MLQLQYLSFSHNIHMRSFFSQHTHEFLPEIVFTHSSFSYITLNNVLMYQSATNPDICIQYIICMYS